MLNKYLFGSQLLKLKYCRDGDWVSFTENPPAEADRKRGVRSIPFHKVLINHFINGKNQPNDPYKALHLYQMSNGFREGDENYPFKDFNILEHKAIWIEQLKGYMNSPETEEKALKEDVLPKNFYHIVYQYQMILENTHFISEEAKADVQKIHDFEMPSAYFYELRDKINSL
jgi:hypothetical protein